MHTDQGGAKDEPIPNVVSNFFKDMKVEVVSEMNKHYKIIKYTFDDLDSNGSDEDEAQNEFHFLVSYQVLGQNKDKACISMLEVDI